VDPVTSVTLNHSWTPGHSRSQGFVHQPQASWWVVANGCVVVVRAPDTASARYGRWKQPTRRQNTRLGVGVEYRDTLPRWRPPVIGAEVGPAPARWWRSAPRSCRRDRAKRAEMAQCWWIQARAPGTAPGGTRQIGSRARTAATCVQVPGCRLDKPLRTRQLTGPQLRLAAVTPLGRLRVAYGLSSR